MKLLTRLTRQLCAALKAHLAGDRPNPPEAGVRLWNAFLALSRTRSYHMAGPEAIRFTEIEAWCRLTRTPLAPHHIRILADMDEAWLEHAYARRGTPEGVKAMPQLSKQPLSAKLFDAVVG